MSESGTRKDNRSERDKGQELSETLSTLFLVARILSVPPDVEVALL